jgi:3-deoxy-D-manno-octulosonic acid (KDO) 8-phosphate synthase
MIRDLILECSKRYYLMRNECALELEESVLKVTYYLPKIRRHFPRVEFIFKISLNKNNYFSLKAARRISIMECLTILEKLKE